MNRREAYNAGLKKFFTDKPCKHGHISERFVSSGACVECYTFSKRRIVNHNNVFTLLEPVVIERTDVDRSLIPETEKILRSWATAAYDAAVAARAAKP